MYKTELQKVLSEAGVEACKRKIQEMDGKGLLTDLEDEIEFSLSKAGSEEFALLLKQAEVYRLIMAELKDRLR